MSSAALTRLTELDRYMGEVQRHPILDREEELRLARAYRDQGDVAAAHALVVANLRFVVKVAHRYRGYGLKMLDLVQEGNLGLMHAVKKYDPDKGYRLISYAVWWIRASIQSFILRSWSLVKVGSGRVRRKLFFKLRSERSRLEQLAGGEGAVDSADLAAALDVSRDDVTDMEMRLGARDFSLDAPLGDGAATHLEMIGSDATQEEAVIASEAARNLRAAVTAATEDLDPRERRILQDRLLAEEPVTLQALGDAFGVSRERARQLEQRLLGKLRQRLAPA